MSIFVSSFASPTIRIIYREVKRALLDADVNLKVTNALLEAVKEKALGKFLCMGVGVKI